MISFKNFIKATNEFNALERKVPAPYIRKSFISDVSANAKLTVASCGFYEIYINGKKYTKGFLAPYISNPEHYIYYDEYEVPLDIGENVIGLLLGNGFQNNPGGHIWYFDKATFRSAPMVAVSLSYINSDGNEIIIKSDSSFKCSPSPIIADDYRFGEYYDANFEIPGWNEKGFDDSSWCNAIETLPPKGDLIKCSAEPIVKECEITPVEIIKDGEDFIYDFGINNTGVCRLTIDGYKGQKIELQHAETLKDGKLFLENVWFLWEFWERDKDIVHKDTYVCSGNGTETYMPTFTYHGFRYVKVSGISEEQATSDLLTYIVLHSDLKSRGDFKCSDDMANTLQKLTRRSDISCFHYFPTDCPQREKNGWTADAALSCEHMLLNYEPEVSYREWMHNICKAQDSKGALPGIIPTTGWGYEWGNGPAWDCVLAYLPYYTYMYRGQTDMIKESAYNFMSYLRYLKTRKDEKGLLHFGLGDWCHVGGIKPKAPLEVTDTIMAMDIANKMSVMFDAIDLNYESSYAKDIALSFKNAIRTHLIDFDNMLVSGNCQTSQAMCLYYGVFEDGECQKAFERLLELIDKADDHIDVGVLGGRVIFHVLSMYGHSDLAYKMITRPDYPSYGNWVARGATTLWEGFWEDRFQSMNHHFWGDISAWFIKRIAGIQFNPDANDIARLDIKPSFVTDLDNAEAYHISPHGKIVSSWKRNEDSIILSLQIPEKIKANVYLEKGFVFLDGTSHKEVNTGDYLITVK